MTTSPMKITPSQFKEMKDYADQGVVEAIARLRPQLQQEIANQVNLAVAGQGGQAAGDQSTNMRFGVLDSAVEEMKTQLTQGMARIMAEAVFG